MKQPLLFVLLSVLLAAANASAQVPAAEWEQFKSQFAAMSERVKALELENQQLRNAGRTTVKVEDLAATDARVDALIKDRSAVSPSSESASWADRVAWKGDYRFRFEEIEQDDRDNRERYRIRARPALIAQVGDTTEVGFGLATGSDDPVSSNQTLGGGSSHKDINLDLAYATWRGLPGTSITAGKFVNPFYTPEKNQLIFDSDFRPEGVAVGWANDMFFATTTFSFIESDSDQTGKNNYGIWVAQVGANLTPFEGAKLKVAAGYIDIPTEGQPAIYDGDFFGNSSTVVDGVEVYEYDYKLITASIDLGVEVFDLPLHFYVDYVENHEVNDLATGYLLGVKLGKAKKKGQWQLKYEYEALDANATLGVVSNSDFAGGGTDNEGSIVSAKYAISDKWYVGSTYFFDNKVGVNLGDDVDYHRLQLDTGFSY